MKPIVIAGNGPSLARIDYRRLPKDVDVFRCNQFYFEDKYYLGRHVRGVFFPKWMMRQQYFQIRALQQRGEYTFDDMYYFADRPDADAQFDWPRVKNAFPYLSAIPEFYELSRFLGLYYTFSFTSGFNMLIAALGMGYKEIYLIGLDFYEGWGGANYAFDTNKPQLLALLPDLKKKGFKVGLGHGKEIDLMALSLAQKMPDVKIYSLCEQTALNEYVPLAPVLHPQIKPVEEKDDDAIKDFLPLPHVLGGHGVRFFRSLDLEDEYLAFKHTLYGRMMIGLIHIMKDTWVCARVLLKVMIKIWRIPFLKMKKRNDA